MEVCKCDDCWIRTLNERDAAVNELEELDATLAARDAEIERLRSLVEKRERQLVWMARAGVWYGSNIMRGYLLHTLEMDEDGDLCGDDRIDCDGTDAGLLAAIDEATAKETDESRQSRPDRHQRRHQPD